MAVGFIRSSERDRDGTVGNLERLFNYRLKRDRQISDDVTADD